MAAPVTNSGEVFRNYFIYLREHPEDINFDKNPLETIDRVFQAFNHNQPLTLYNKVVIVISDLSASDKAVFNQFVKAYLKDHPISESEALPLLDHMGQQFPSIKRQLLLNLKVETPTEGKNTLDSVKSLLSTVFRLQQSWAKEIEENYKDKPKRILTGIGKTVLVGGGVAAIAAGIALGVLIGPQMLLLIPVAGLPFLLSGLLWVALTRTTSRPQYERLEQLEYYKKMALEDKKFQEFVRENPVTLNKEMWRLERYIDLYRLQEQYPAIVAKSKEPGVDTMVVNQHKALEEINQRRIDLGLPKRTDRQLSSTASHEPEDFSG